MSVNTQRIAGLWLRVCAGALRSRHQEVDKEDMGGDSPAEVVLGGRAQPDVPQRK